MKLSNKWLSVLLIIVLVAGCAGMQVKSQEGAYYKALGIWYDAAMKFKFYYEKTDDIVLKEKWDAEFRPLLIKSKEVLNLWNFHLQNGDPTADDMEAWKLMSDELLFYIATQMKAKEAS